MEHISGIVERITYKNEENGYCVIKIKSKGFYDLITVIGSIASVNVGSIIKVHGEWKNNAKYGKQFSVNSYEEVIPATTTGIEKYLGSGLIKGIGPVYAKKIVKQFKENTLKIIEENMDELLKVPGIGEKRLEMIKNTWLEQKEIKNVMLFLQSNEISTSFAVKIFKTYGNKSIEIVKENPYKLADDIWGIGFKSADKIAQKIGFDKNSFERCSSGIIYVLNQLSNDGHCYEPKAPLIEKSEKILEIDNKIIESTLNEMITLNTVILDGEDSIFLPTFYHSEIGVSKIIKNILSKKSQFEKENLDELINKIEIENKIEYDEIQKEAIKTALKSKMMILTGGPGTGKTTTTLAIIKAFESLKANVLLAAPTGRAAKRMSETTGMESKTIHRLLEFKPSEGYKKNEENPLDCDVLILDEVSMVDIILMYNLLKAVKNDTILIFVGDVDQLPSVGAGNVLKDIINSNAVNVVKLTRIFRQALGSAIITNAHKINNGQFPIIKNTKNTDFFFIEEDEPEKIVQKIRYLCVKKIPEIYKIDPLNDIQVLCPMQRGETGAVNLNQILQKALNKSLTSIKYGGIIYKLGDKVMQIKNNYDKNVFNGDIGKIIDIDLETKNVIIEFDETPVNYDSTELDEIILAYATTVHKSQGSEYKIVVCPLTTQHYMMLQRNLIYTCVTRAKKILMLIGSKKALRMAVKNNKTTKRNTKLCERLQNNDI
jgi:exodeoxyribonuclease V alpha subunit